MMICKKCGGTLIYSDGVYVCNNCGSKYSVTDYYENIDTYLCYIESDDWGRRTKDSIIAQDIYQMLESNKINTFFSRLSAGNLVGEELERVSNAAIHSAKTILVIGTQKQYFEMVFDKYSEFLDGKIVIPIYSDMDAHDIPKQISAIQALDFNRVGAISDLIKSLLNALGRENEIDFMEMSQKTRSGRKKATGIILTSFIVIIIAVTIFIIFSGRFSHQDEVIETTLSPDEVVNNQYKEAMAYVEKKDYVKAIEMLTDLDGYNDSDKQLMAIYEKYAGYYRNEAEGVSVHIQVWDGGSSAIELTKITESGDQCKVIESTSFEENTLAVEYNDSENNQGQISLLLENEDIILKVSTTNEIGDISMGNFEIAFSLANKSDKPFTPPLDAETLLSFVNNRTSLSYLKRSGYEIEFVETFYSYSGASKYKIKNTDIYFAIFDFDITTTTEWSGNEFTTPLNDNIVFGVSAPASVIIPDMIGVNNDVFVKDDILYVPEGTFIQGNLPLEFNGEYIEAGTISNNTNVCFTSKELFGQAHFEELSRRYMGAKYLEKVMDFFNSTLTDNSITAFGSVVDENSEAYLIEVRYRNGINLTHVYYRISKTTNITERIAVFQNCESNPETPIYMSYPDLFSEFL